MSNIATSQTDRAEPNSVATPSQPHRRRLHRSTWIILQLTFLALLLANIPGSYEGGQAILWPTEVHHGWPWVYLERDVNFMLDGFQAPLWQLGNHPKSFNYLAALGNIAVGLAILVTVGMLAERRRRRRNRFWQITLAETLFAVLLLSIGSAAWGWLLNVTNRQVAAINAATSEHSYLRVMWESPFPNWWTGHWATDQQPWPGHVVAIHRFHTLLGEFPPAHERLLSSMDQLPAVRELLMAGDPIADLSLLENLEHCPRLQMLDLSQTGLTDDALDPISRVSTLIDLDLSYNSFSDDGLKKLQALKHLKYLNLTNTGASDEAVEALQQALPELEITDD